MSCRARVLSSNAFLFWPASPQLLGGLDVQRELAALLLDHHAIVALRGFQRYIPGAHVSKDALGCALKGTPKSPASGGFDQKSFALRKIRGLDLSRGEFLRNAIVAQDRYTVRQRHIAPVKPPGHADRAFHT